MPSGESDQGKDQCRFMARWASVTAERLARDGDTRKTYRRRESRVLIEPWLVIRAEERPFILVVAAMVETKT